MNRHCLRRSLSTVEELRRFGWQRASFNPLHPSPPPSTGLERVYCGSIGAEFEHLSTPAERAWFAHEMETSLPAFSLSPSDKKNYWRLLASAEVFEGFLSKKLTTLKRYGGEGAEAQLPALHVLLSSLCASGALQAVVSSAHRGRLATQVSLLRYPARKLFWKLRGYDDIPQGYHGLDDVSSHVAVSSDLFVGRPWGSGGGPSGTSSSSSSSIHVSLLPNPSHLEAVNPVAMGLVRAKQEALGGVTKAVSICVHGDAAVAGQGVVYETSALSAAPTDYGIGGTLHLICNNQVGFTHATSTAGAFARGAGAPILHVNAESPEAVVFACRLAAAYRARFHKDAVVDLVGFRRNGHNEVDEPSFTNPAMYAAIRARPSHTAAYARALLEQGVLTPEEHERTVSTMGAHLEGEWVASEPSGGGGGGKGGFTPATGSMVGGSVAEDGAGFSTKAGRWGGFRPAETDAEVGSCPPTGVDLTVLRGVGRGSVALPPPPFTLHPRLLKGHVTPRLEALEEGKETQGTLDWATAEALAFGSLLLEGVPVRVAGQDSQRGTFSHRHAVLHCQSPEGSALDVRHTPLSHLHPSQAPFYPVSSPLTEFAALGFEYGYSLYTPHSLVLWEAQFGDFANCAQVIIDTFISGGESKWLRSSGLVLLLPHGQDGAGPEHSSARIERFLQLVNSQALAGVQQQQQQQGGEGQWGGDKTRLEPCNLVVVQPTTPANYFHVLRRQTHSQRPFRKPLVVIAPKQLLRSPAALSPLSHLSPGTSFEPVLWSGSGGSGSGSESGSGSGSGSGGAPGQQKQAQQQQRLLLCSGKVYYELVARREKLGGAAAAGTVIVRLEQLAPFPLDRLAQVLREEVGWRGEGEVLYVQEEPANGGAWAWVESHWRASPELSKMGALRYCGRPALAAPAVGLSAAFKKQQENIFATAFA